MRKPVGYFCLCVTFIFCIGCVAGRNTPPPASGVTANQEVKERFIPVELFTGMPWDGEHILEMKEAKTSTCASSDGKRCDTYRITGPFTKETISGIEWAGEQISYYKRTYRTPSRTVESHYTINKTKDGLVRIFDKRNGVERTFSGKGNKFPLGLWKQGEVRTYDDTRPVKIEIMDIDGSGGCLTFRWTLGGGGWNRDNIYTFCPNRGLVKIRH